jgi:hypothetical protein
MTRASNPLNFAQKICLWESIVAAMLIAKLFHSCFVCRRKVFSNDFFGDVSANILAVVTRLFCLCLLLFWLEDFRKFTRLAGWRMIRKDKRSFSKAWYSHKITKDSIIRSLAWEPISWDKQLLSWIVKVKFTICHHYIIIYRAEGIIPFPNLILIKSDNNSFTSKSKSNQSSMKIQSICLQKESLEGI